MDKQKSQEIEDVTPNRSRLSLPVFVPRAQHRNKRKISLDCTVAEGSGLLLTHSQKLDTSRGNWSHEPREQT